MGTTHEQKDYTTNEEAFIKLRSFQHEGRQDVRLRVNLSTAQQEEITNVLEKYNDVSTDFPGKTSLIEHRVDLAENKSIRSNPHPLLYTVQKKRKEKNSDTISSQIILELKSLYV